MVLHLGAPTLSDCVYTGTVDYPAEPESLQVLKYGMPCVYLEPALLSGGFCILHARELCRIDYRVFTITRAEA